MDHADDDRLFETLMGKLEHKINVFAFSEADIVLEQNFTEGDVEVVIFAKGVDIGMKRFWLFAPNGRAVYKFRAPEEWMEPGVEYQVVVGIVNEAGNKTFVEQSVFTAAE